MSRRPIRPSSETRPTRRPVLAFDQRGASIFTDIGLAYRPVIGERVHFWTGRGSQGYAVVREIRFGERLGQDRFMLEPEQAAVRGGDYWPRGGRSYWGPRDYGVTLAQLEDPARIWFENF